MNGLEATRKPEDAADSVLAGLALKPFRIARPAAQSTPFVFASPHSGRTYPPSFAELSRLAPLTLRRSEDAYADELFAWVTQRGAPLIAALFPRVYVDANRAASELDESMFDGPLTVDVAEPGARVAAGLGVIPRVVRDGAEIYGGKLSPSEAANRLTRFYRPYHAALARLVEETFARFGAVVVIDCHTMPSGPSVPDVVFGDCYGASASPSLLRHAERVFEASGFSTVRNTPYAGGYTTHLYARRERGIHAVQIEVNRGLYLNEDKVEPGPRFEAVRNRLEQALDRLMTFDLEMLRPHRSLAAE
jgi:N-formylglutamate amidohydrolase